MLPLRYVIVGMAMLMAVLLYLERVCVSVAEVYIREDLRIGRMEMDYAFGAFFIAYAIGQVPSSWLSQRYGPRLMLTLYMVGWSVFGVFIALSQDFWTLFFSRFLLGLSQAGAYPTAAILVKRWMPDRSLGVANSIVAFGGRFGGAGATWLTGLLIIACVPMSRDATVTEADLTLVEEITNDRDGALRSRGQTGPLKNELDRVFWAIHDRFPEKYLDADGVRLAINAVITTPGLLDDVPVESLKLTYDTRAIRAKPVSERTAEESARLNRVIVEQAVGFPLRSFHGQGWRPALMSYGVLGVVVGLLIWFVVRNSPREHPWISEGEKQLILAGQAPSTIASTAIPWKALMTSLNQWLYSLMHFFSNFGWVFLITLMPRFLSERFKVPLDQRGLMTTIPLFVAAFGMIAGGVTTDWLTARYGKRWGRAWPVGVMKFPCAIMLGISPFLPDPWTVVLALSLMSICQDFGIPAVWAFAQDTGGANQAGAVLGWGNMWGNLGAGIAPPILGALGANLGWNFVLFTGAAAFVMCGTCGLLMRADRPLWRTPPAD
jgi:MFS transporter, ACS family, glucarate transporter